MMHQAAAPRVDLPESEVVLPLLDWGNRPIVELTINGTGPHRFILDTGAMETVIDAGLVVEIGLPEISKQMIQRRPRTPPGASSARRSSPARC